ncbi:PDZ domain-containing protein [Streptomyces sp. SudanB182_2057]|uniref:PDZ domain-containing protein n=1 Tax=Streptomyces sp. SudanB182_2057 TaxID=3035281 RepID=UPI003F569938
MTATPGRIAAKYHQDFGHGLKVESVEKGSNTAKSGLLVGDIIIKVDGKPTALKKEETAALVGKLAGNPVSLVVKRDGHQTAFNVILDPA